MTILQNSVFVVYQMVSGLLRQLGPEAENKAQPAGLKPIIKHQWASGKPPSLKGSILLQWSEADSAEDHGEN